MAVAASSTVESLPGRRSDPSRPDPSRPASPGDAGARMWAVTLPRRPRWYHHVAPVSATILCEGEQHRVSWQRGKLVLHDHDLSAERAMLVLGGEPGACLRALRLWRDQFGMPPELFNRMHTWMGADAVLAPKELDLPRGLAMTWSWARAWRRSSYLDKQGRLLQEQAKERALPLFRQHLTAEKQRFGSRVISSAQVRIVPDREEATVTGQMDKVGVRAEAALHAWWLVEVWPLGIAVVDGAFVVEMVERHWTRPLVRAARWEDSGPARRAPVVALARLHASGEGSWRLRWEEGPEAVGEPAPPGPASGTIRK